MCFSLDIEKAPEIQSGGFRVDKSCKSSVSGNSGLGLRVIRV